MRKGQKRTHQQAEKITYVERIEKRTKKKNLSGSRTKNLRGIDGATANDAPTKKLRKQSPWNGWSHGQRRTHQEAERRTSGERMELRPTTHPSGSREHTLRGTDKPRPTTHPARSREHTLRGTDEATANQAPRRTPSKEPPGNGWSHGQPSTPQDAERSPSVERMKIRTKKTYVERIEKRPTKNLRGKD